MAQSNPRCFVVSLANAAERRRQVEKTFDAAELPFEFLDAVDGRVVDTTGLVDAVLIRRNIGRDLSPGEIGCSLSHRLLYQRIVDEGLPGAFVFEDDITLEPGAKPHFLSISDGMAQRADERILVHLTGSYMLRHRDTLLSRKARIAGDGFALERYLRGSEVAGTWGYFITRAAAASILAREPRVLHVADGWKYRLLNGTLDSIYLMTPDAVHHPRHATGSGIERDRASLSSGRADEISSLRFRFITAAKGLLYPLLGRLM